MVKNPFASAGDTGDMVRSQEREMATHSSILAWELPWWAGGATVYGVSKSWMGARACFSLNQLEVTHPFILLVTLLLSPLLGGAFCSSRHRFPDS